MILKKRQKTVIMSGDSGFTLIEVLIAIAIFSIGFLAVASLQINALNKTTSARNTTSALILAMDQAERLRALPFYIENWNILPELEARDASEPHDNNLPPYTVRWTVTDDEPLPAYDPNVLSPSGGEHRSKTIRIWVTPDNNPDNILSEIIFTKYRAGDK